MNFEKDYLGTDNTKPKVNSWEISDITSKEDRPNLEALKGQRDKYIDKEIKKFVNDKKDNDYKQDWNAHSTIQEIKKNIFSAHGIEVEKIDFDSVEFHDSYDEFYQAYADSVIAKRLLEPSSVIYFDLEQKGILMDLAKDA